MTKHKSGELRCPATVLIHNVRESIFYDMNKAKDLYNTLIDKYVNFKDEIA